MKCICASQADLIGDIVDRPSDIRNEVSRMERRGLVCRCPEHPANYVMTDSGRALLRRAETRLAALSEKLQHRLQQSTKGR